MTVEKAQVEKQSFLDSLAEKNYFLGENLQNYRHCFSAKGDVTTLCRRLGVDADFIDVMNCEQLRDVHIFLKTAALNRTQQWTSISSKL